jgi:hypothetical protein
MKLLVAIVIPCFILMRTCTMRNADTIPASKQDETAPVEKKIDFEKDVLPVLVQNCSPCHFPGGKMYEKLPFDKEATILNNSDKILKRVATDEKKSMIRKFILQNKNGSPGGQAATNKN